MFELEGEVSNEMDTVAVPNLKSRKTNKQTNIEAYGKGLRARLQ